MNAQWISALTALAAVILSPVVSIYVVKKQINATVVSMNRQKWIDDLRDQLSELISLLNYINVAFHSHLSNKENFMEKLERVKFIQTKIMLLINPIEEDHVKLTSLISSAIEEIIKGKKEELPNKLHEYIKALVELSQKVLKREWERVKKGN